MTMSHQVKCRSGKFETTFKEFMVKCQNNPFHAAFDMFIEVCGKCAKQDICIDQAVKTMNHAREIMDAYILAIPKGQLVRQFTIKLPAAHPGILGNFAGIFSAKLEAKTDDIYKKVFKQIIGKCGNCLPRHRCIDRVMKDISTGKSIPEAIALMRFRCTQPYSVTIDTGRVPNYSIFQDHADIKIEVI